MRGEVQLFDETPATLGDPLDAQSVEFPFDEVFAHLDGEEAGPDVQRERVLEAIRGLFHWLVRDPGVRDGESLEETYGRRLIGFVWALDPSILGGASLSDIARQTRTSKRNLAKHAERAAATFGISNRTMRGRG